MKPKITFYWKLPKDVAEDYRWAAMQLVTKHKQAPPLENITLIEVIEEGIRVSVSEDQVEDGTLISEVLLRFSKPIQGLIKATKRPPPIPKSRFEREDLL